MNFENISFLPETLKSEILRVVNPSSILEEIRIRKNRNAYLIISGKNILLDVIVREDEMLEIIRNLTRNSLYAYQHTIVNGFIPFDNGIRIGVVGSAGTDSKKIVGIYDINEIAIRIPHMINVDLSSIIDLVRDHSVLFYSPPGEGKTTVLRNIICLLSNGNTAKRVGVVDTRGELSYLVDSKSSLAILLNGYPRKNGIEIAIRTMNAQSVICDEIGDENDSIAFLDAQGAGVPIIASCHGRSLKDIFSHNGILKLHEHRIFDYYIGIKRSENINFIFTINTWSEADDSI